MRSQTPRAREQSTGGSSSASGRISESASPASTVSSHVSASSLQGTVEPILSRTNLITCQFLDAPTARARPARIASPPVFLRFRDVHGEIYGETTVRPEKGKWVPSFGADVDAFLDDWGYDDDFVDILFDLVTLDPVPQDVDEFAIRVAKYLPWTEARWLYTRMTLPLEEIDRRRPFATS